jgi:FkbM family methyltransferase
MKSFSTLSDISQMNRAEFEQACIDNTDHLYIGNDTVLCKVLARHKMYVDSKDMGITPHLIMDGYWEVWITKLLAEIIQSGFTCLDIGANFGYFSILMSELTGSTGKTFSIEPNPRIAELLRSTRFVNGGKFEVIETALSDKKGEATLTISDRELGGGTIKNNEMEKGRSQVVVQTISVDELVKEKKIGKVDVIKMDVEGVEPLVFAGMQETIATNPEIQIIVEYSPSIYEDPQKFTDYLFSEFTICKIRDFVEITELQKSDIPELLKISDHADLYLRRK